MDRRERITRAKRKEMKSFVDKKIKKIDFADLFSPCYYPMVQNSLKAVHGQVYKKIVQCAGGRASGKSQALFDLMIALLPLFKYGDGMVVTYSNKHKENTARLLRTKLNNHGHRFKQKRTPDGDIVFLYGNHNSITLLSVKSGSKAEEIDKLKTSANYNMEHGGQLIFLACEEFTSIVSIFEDYMQAINAISSFGRLAPERGILNTFYVYNPPDDANDEIYRFEDWLEAQSDKVLTIKTTIFDLKPEWRSLSDLEIIEGYKAMGNQDAIDHYYLGIPKLSGTLAFRFNYDFLIKNIDDLRFKDYQIVVDNGNKDATTFGLFGVTHDNTVVRLYTYYHSGRSTNELVSYSTYAKDLKDWVEEFRQVDIYPSAIVTDSLTFTTECTKIGLETQYMEKRATQNATFRELCYDFMDEIVRQHRYLVYDIPENKIAVDQIRNARIDRRGNNKKIAKVDNTTTVESKQIHCVDTDVYFVYNNSQMLLGREEHYAYNRFG